jgi:outer membrane protein TolC
MRVRFLWLALPAYFAAASFASVDDLILPEELMPALQPILRDAVRQSPRMVSRAFDVEIAEQARIAARAGLLPSLGGSASIIESQDRRADLVGALDVSKTYYSYAVNQPLFHWGALWNNARSAEISKAMAERNFSQAYRLLAQELRQKYLNLTVHKMLVARARRNLAHTIRERDLAEERLRNRQISELQAHPLRIAAEQAEITRDRTEFDYQIALDSFARLAGIPSFQEDQIPDSIPIVQMPMGPLQQALASFLSLAELPTAEAVNARDQIRIEDINYRNQKTRLRPKFNFVVGVSQDEQSYTINIAQKYRIQSFYAGVSVGWTLFDGFAAQAGQRSALARRRQLQNDYVQMKDRLSEQAQVQVRQLEFAARTMSIADRNLEGAYGLVQTRQDEFKRGIGTETEIAIADLALFDARIAAYNQRIDYLIRVGDFLGTLAQDPVVSNLSIK